MSLISESVLGILVASIIILLYLHIKRRLAFFEKQGLPYVKPTFISVLKSFQPTAMNELPEEIYKMTKDSDSSVTGFYHTFLTPAVLVMDPNMVEKVLIKDFSHFHDHGLEVDVKRNPLAGHLFNMKGDEWRALRNKLLPTFTSGKLKGMIPTMDSCARTLVDVIKKDQTMTDVNLKDMFKRYSLSVIADSIFALDPSSISDPDCQFRKIATAILTPTPLLQVKLFFLISFPKLANLLKLTFFPLEHENFFLNLTKDTLDTRKKSGVKRNDFIQLLLELREKGTVQIDHKDLEDDEKDKLSEISETESSNTKLEMTNELLAAQVFVFLIGGFDNTANLVALTLYLLSKNKDIQDRVRQEVNDAVSKHDGVNYSSLKEMKLLESSINEALRMYPPLIVLIRKCNKTLNLGDGQRIEKGTNVMIPAKSLQNDSRYWQNPEQFNPDRFLNDDIVPGTYLPFGDGPRLCIAQRLALLLGKVMLAQILMNFDVLHSKKTIEPIKHKTQFTSEVIGGLWGVFKPLKQ